MCKGVKNILFPIILILSVSFLAPLRTYADSISDYILGVNVSYQELSNELVRTGITEHFGTYTIDVQLDGQYLGYVDFQYALKYRNYAYGASTPSWSELTTTFRRNIWVYGDHFSFTISVSWYSDIGGISALGTFVSGTYNVVSSDVQPINSFTSYSDIINYLISIESYLGDMQIDLSAVNSWLEDNNELLYSISNDTWNISRNRQYNYPIGCYPFVNYMLKNQSSRLTHYRFANTEFTFPIFTLYTYKVYEGTLGGTNDEIVMVFGTDRAIYDISTFNSHFSYTGMTLYSVDNLYESGTFRILKIVFNSSNNFGTKNVTSKVNSSSNVFMPIFFGTMEQARRLPDDYISQFGLLVLEVEHNDLSTDDFVEERNDLIDIENTYNDDFNDMIGDIDFTSPLENQNLLGSSSLLVSIFNQMIFQNPFSILILIVAILIVGKRVIGK